MTEDEAKMKWCPYGRIGWLEECRDGVAAAAINEPSIEKYRQNCIGSDCMAWHWNERRDEKGSQLKYIDGYCGLAGK